MDLLTGLLVFISCITCFILGAHVNYRAVKGESPLPALRRPSFKIRPPKRDEELDE